MGWLADYEGRVGAKSRGKGGGRGGGKSGERRFWVIDRECKIRDDVKSGGKRRGILKNRKRGGGWSGKRKCDVKSKKMKEW